MPLEAGTRLGVFEILALLGKGGMGEVYRAKDTKLEREVAVKILPKEMGERPERMSRFEREARLLAALDQPHIAGIHGLHEEDGQHFLVMELVDGETLADRLKRGALPVQDSLHVGRQVCAALEAAHERGIVHRDLKPGNVMVTPDGDVKLLDFGLAKALVDPVGDDTDLSKSPTVSGLPTQEGAILGTAAYMSPEQARGKPVDKRTDVWAFGCLLYETLTARRAFEAATLSDTLAATLTQEPDWSRLPPEVPERVRLMLARCLRKDARDRLRDIGDARIEIEDADREELWTTPRAKAQRPRALALGVAVAFGVALGIATQWARSPTRPVWKAPTTSPEQVLRQTGQVDHAALAPDGESFVYVVNDDLYSQTLAGGEPRQLTDDGAPKKLPRFSADGTQLLFARRSPNSEGWALYVMDLPASLPRLLLEDADRGLWSPDGRRLAFVRHSTREAFVANREGRDPVPLGAAKIFDWALGMSWSPDGETLAVVDQGDLYVNTLSGGKRQKLSDVRAIDVLYTPDGDHLLVVFGHGSRWTLGQVRVAGGMPVPFHPVPFEASGVTLSRDGSKLMVVLKKVSFDLFLQNQSGHRVRQLTFGGTAINPSVSPDERRIVYSDWRSLWLVEAAGGESRRLAGGLTYAVYPEWSPDGETIVFGNGVDDEILTIRLDEGQPRAFSPIDGKKRWASFTADSGSIVFALHKGDASDLWLAPYPSGAGQALTAGGVSGFPRASPVDSRIAYLRRTAEGNYQVCIVDYRSRRESVIVEPKDLALFGELWVQPARWSRDGVFLYLPTSESVLRIEANSGKVERLFPAIPTAHGWDEEVTTSFDVLSGGREMVFSLVRSDVQPWLYTDLK